MARQILNNGEFGSVVRAKLNSNFTELYEGSINVKHAPYGAVGDGVANDTVAIMAAIDAAKSNNAGFDSPSIYFPSGTYLVDDGVFTYGSLASGILFYGDGWTSTTIKLRADGVNQVYLYNNQGMQSYRNTFMDMRFLGEDRNYCNGFRMNETLQHEKKFTFFRCRFEDINNVLHTTGTTTADQCMFYHCEWYLIRTLIRLDNLQSMLHYFFGCTGTFVSDLIVLEDGGGGEVHYIGGDLIQIPEASVATYWVRGDAGPLTGLSTGNITFNTTRAELRTQYARLVYWPTADTNNHARQVRIAFHNVNLSQAIQSSGVTRESVVIGGGKFVVFDNCNLPTIAAGANDDFSFTITSTDNVAGAVPSMGKIVFRDCHVPRNLASKCVITNLFGVYEATGNVAVDGASDADRIAVNFNKNWTRSSLGNASAPTHKVSLIRRYWPRSNGAGGYTGEMTMTIPAGSIIEKIVIDKPAQGSSSADAQFFVSNNDKSATYASTTLARVDARHTAVADDLAVLPAGPLVADLVLRLHVVTTSTLVQEGGYAYVQYC